MENLDSKKKYIQNLKSERDLILIFSYETILELKLFIIKEKEWAQNVFQSLYLKRKMNR